MKVAAALILAVYNQTQAKGFAILETAANSTRNDADKVNILLCLLYRYRDGDEYDKALAVGKELAKQYPESELLFSTLSFLLRSSGRFDEADALAGERLKGMPDDLAAMRALVYNATARGDYAKAYGLAQNIVDEGKAEPNDLNNLAWGSLFVGRVGPQDIDNALKAAKPTKSSSYILHTLGCLYAEAGKTRQAREVLVQSMDLRNMDEPSSEYWYAFGRIAEQYGERDAAFADYARVTKPKRAFELPDSTYYLAQIRLQAMHREKR
jgi:tetratricopeptide (TPR) repeat protein